MLLARKTQCNKGLHFHKKVSVKLIQVPSNPQLSFYETQQAVCVHIQRTKNNASEEKQGGGREILIPRKIYYKGIQIKTARYGIGIDKKDG